MKIKDTTNALVPVLTHFLPFYISIFLNFLNFSLEKHKNNQRKSENHFKDSH